MSEVIYGDTSTATASVKYISLLICFLAAFTCFIHSARYFVHATFLLSTLNSNVPVEYVQIAVIWGGNFWAMGLRALYFATTLLLWIFGPIPMFICSVFMVVILGFLDSNSTPLHRFSFSSSSSSSHSLNQRLKKIHGAFADLSDIHNHPLYIVNTSPFISTA
ncbi:hypothetical protein DsansV1_C09g0089271 [Dioscorea sansibarensis]